MQGHTIRKNPNELRKAAAFSPVTIDSSIWKPPGVRIMPKASQKPPYDERAVAPKVLPTAISLRIRQPSCLREASEYLPHASQQLHQPTIPECNANHNIRHSDIRSSHIDQAQHKGGESKSAESQRRRVGEFTIGDLLVGTGLELTTKSRKTVLGGVDMSQRAVAETSGGLGS